MKPEYNYEERAAQAEALGLSYGKFMSLIARGGQLPEQKHPIQWPAGSRHAGEVHVYVGGFRGIPANGKKPPDKIPTANQVAPCQQCGEVYDKVAMFGIYITVPGSRSKTVAGFLCEACFPDWIRAFRGESE